MTLPDPRRNLPGGELPSNERGEDEEREAVTRRLLTEGSRPLTRDEKDAAEHDSGVAERVFAPASQRVPVEPVPGHREFVEHPDTSTPERLAAGEDAGVSQATRPSGTHSGSVTPTSSPSRGFGSMDEPSFTRVSRPSSQPAAGTAYAGHASFNPYGADSRPRPLQRWLIAAAIGWASAATCVWLFVRWRRERNKPINRLRRQAQHAAAEIRERVPSTDEMVQPTMGLLAAGLSALVVVLRALREQQSEVVGRAGETISDTDMQKRLNRLKQRWSPRRLELEKISISRH